MTIPVTGFEALLETVKHVIFRRLMHAAQVNQLANQTDDTRQLVVFLVTFGDQLRYTALYQESEVQTIWDMLRENGPGLEFLERCLSDFYLHYTMGAALVSEREAHWQLLIKSVAEAMTVMRRAEYSAAQSDMDYRMRAFDQETWVMLLSDNPWLMFLILLDMTGMTVDDLNAAINPVKPGVPRRA